MIKRYYNYIMVGLACCVLSVAGTQVAYHWIMRWHRLSAEFTSIELDTCREMEEFSQKLIAECSEDLTACTAKLHHDDCGLSINKQLNDYAITFCGEDSGFGTSWTMGPDCSIGIHGMTCYPKNDAQQAESEGEETPE